MVQFRVSVEERSILGFDHEGNRDQSDERYESDIEEQIRCGVESVGAASRDRTNEEWTDRRHYTSCVVREAGTGAAQARGVQFGEVIREAAKDAKHREARERD